jgi:hypothetical protein
MSEKANQRLARVILVCVLGAGVFAVGLFLNQAPAGRATGAGILLGIVALIPVSLLLMFERMNYRVSLRGLLIVTAIFAAGLGVAVYVLR